MNRAHDGSEYEFGCHAHSVLTHSPPVRAVLPLEATPGVISLLAGKDARYHEGQIWGNDGEDGDRENSGCERSVRQTEHALGGFDKASASLWVQHKGEKLFTREFCTPLLLSLCADASG